MRKWIAVLLAVLLLVGGATTALAVLGTDFYPVGASLDNGVFSIETLQTSALSESTKVFMEEWISIFMKESSGYIFLYYARSGANDVLVFCSTASKPTLFHTTSPSSFEATGSSAFRSVSFVVPYTSSVPVLYTPVSTSVSSIAKISNSSFRGLLFSNIAVDASVSKFMPDGEYVQITDDGGLFGTPDLPDPEPEPEPEPPPPVTPPSIPEIPAIKNDFIPYDTTRWNGFLDRVVTAIGNSTNIGWIIFGIIAGILVVIKVVKHFTKG